MDWSDRRVLVLGAGRTGQSAAAFLAERGARVVVADERAAAKASGCDARVEWRCGVPFPALADFDTVVPSPGVPPARYRDARDVRCDIEIAAEAIPAPVVAITGSNGKTTTALLLEAMLRSAGRRARAGGNLGVPALDLVGEALDVAVLEVSSFQLESCQHFRPQVAAVLNLSPDHLDRHGSVEAYAAAKARIFAHQEASDVAIVNGDSAPTLALAAGARSTLRQFSVRRGGPPFDAWIEAGGAHCVHDGAVERLALPASESLASESLLAGALCCSALGVAPSEGARAWASFRAPAHRRELVAEWRGIRFVNDSKATNPSAAQHALERCPGPAIWIAGGREKGGLSLDALIDAAATRARYALWYGETADLLEAACAGHVAGERVADLAEAVRRAAERAQPGDTVLLSPAFSSFDQFRDYEERGECFRREVAALTRAGESR